MIYFYPHSYLRDRHLDTIRRWPKEEVLNADLFTGRTGNQVQAATARSGRMSRSWRHALPVPNIKRRPSGLPPNSIVYLWGAIPHRGRFIVDLDNPYSLVAYNLKAMPLWQPLLRRLLGSERCVEVRCISEACRRSVLELFGEDVGAKAAVHYPVLDEVRPVEAMPTHAPRLLYVATQFELKGGPALLRAFGRLREQLPEVTLDLVTHLPPEFEVLAGQAGVTVHRADLGRDELADRFFTTTDVLVHPTYVESFGMVVLEAIAHGLAVVATDVYALEEMVQDLRNGRLLAPPISIWDGVRPSALHYRLKDAQSLIRATDTRAFEDELVAALLELLRDPAHLVGARQASRSLYQERFAR